MAKDAEEGADVEAKMNPGCVHPCSKLFDMQHQRCTLLVLDKKCVLPIFGTRSACLVDKLPEKKCVA